MKTKEELLKKYIYSSHKLDHSDGTSSYIVDKYCYLEEEFKQRVDNLIKFHEDRIEELIKEIKSFCFEYEYFMEDNLFERVKQEYESIMAIEKEFGDVI